MRQEALSNFSHLFVCNWGQESICNDIRCFIHAATEGIPDVNRCSRSTWAKSGISRFLLLSNAKGTEIELLDMGLWWKSGNEWWRHEERMYLQHRCTFQECQYLSWCALDAQSKSGCKGEGGARQWSHPWSDHWPMPWYKIPRRRVRRHTY